MDLNRYWHMFLGYLHSEGWVVQVFLVIFVSLMLDWTQKRLMARLQVKLRHTRTFWDDALADAARRPLSLLIWVLGLAFAAEIVRAKSHAVIFTAVTPIRDVGVVVIIAWFQIRFIERAHLNIVQHAEQRGEPVDKTTADAIAKLLRISVGITAMLVILQTLGYSISGVLAFGGIGGIAVGFAAKDMLANFFGGLMIYMDRPFEVGNWIRSPDRNIEGTVENIGWRLTRIRTFDKRPLFVPNAIFTSIAVENPSRMSNRRIYETVGIRYDDAGKMEAIVKDVENMLRGHPDIDTSATLMVNFNEFAASSLNFFIYTFTRTVDWVEFHKVKQDVLLKVIDIIEGNGAECAFPTSTIHFAEPPAAQR